jgi:hypothetical protein
MKLGVVVALVHSDHVHPLHPWPPLVPPDWEMTPKESTVTIFKAKVCFRIRILLETSYTCEV